MRYGVHNYLYDYNEPQIMDGQLKAYIGKDIWAIVGEKWEVYG